MERCGARRPSDPEGWYLCELPKGHTFPHSDRDYDTWSNGMEEPKTDMGAVIDAGGHNTDRPCRLPFGHDGEHSDAGQCPATIGRRGEGENRDLVIYRCDGPVGHGGVHHNEEHKHAWNQDGYSFETIPADKLTGRPTEDIIRELAERLTRLESREFDARVTRLEGKVRGLSDEETRARVAGPGLTHLSVAALTSQLRKLTEVLDQVTRLESPAPVEVERDPGPEPCPVTVRANVSGSTPWNCILHRDHGGMHTDSEGYTWTVAGV